MDSERSVPLLFTLAVSKNKRIFPIADDENPSHRVGCGARPSERDVDWQTQVYGTPMDVWR